MFTYVDHADIVGVNTVFGRQPQEPAAEQEGLGEVGHGYWDEAHVGAQLQQWTASPCGGCGRKLALTLKGSNKGGVGGGTLNFACAKCDHEYPLQRSRNVVTGIRGRPTEENTVRFISACLDVRPWPMAALPGSSKTIWRLLATNPSSILVSDLIFNLSFQLQLGTSRNV